MLSMPTPDGIVARLGRTDSLLTLCVCPYFTIWEIQIRSYQSLFSNLIFKKIIFLPLRVHRKRDYPSM